MVFVSVYGTYLRRSRNRHVDAVVVLDALRPALLVAGRGDACIVCQQPPASARNHVVLIHTSALAKLVHDLVDGSPPVLPQVLFPRNLVDGRVLLVAGQLSAGVCECRKNDAERSAVAENRRRGAA